jgi:hypothetical protein
MRENLFKHINVDPRHIFIPMGMADDVHRFCAWYEEKIKQMGGIDLQILGIGANGHIAFNEPGSSLGSRTRIKTLSEKTIRDNRRFFSKDEEVPRYAITMGVGTIMDGASALAHCERRVEGGRDTGHRRRAHYRMVPRNDRPDAPVRDDCGRQRRRVGVARELRGVLEWRGAALSEPGRDQAAELGHRSRVIVRATQRSGARPLWIKRFFFSSIMDGRTPFSTVSSSGCPFGTVSAYRWGS